MRGFKRRLHGIGILVFVILSITHGNGRADVVDCTVSPQPDGTNFNVFVTRIVSTNADGIESPLIGPLQEVTDGTNTIPFLTVVNTSLLEVDAFVVVAPADVLTNSVALMFTNDSMIEPIVTAPIFVKPPANQSVFVGGVAVFSASAAHTSGCQWQFQGTNLVESAHYSGVATPTLTIFNVQPADAGDYTVVAAHPLTAAVADAALSVYKPMALGLAAMAVGGGYALWISNQDGSPFETARVANLQIYWTTNLDPAQAAWNLEAAAGGITNGVLQIPFPGCGSAARFWRVFEP